MVETHSTLRNSGVYIERPPTGSAAEPVLRPFLRLINNLPRPADVSDRKIGCCCGWSHEHLSVGPLVAANIMWAAAAPRGVTEVTKCPTVEQGVENGVPAVLRFRR